VAVVVIVSNSSSGQLTLLIPLEWEMRSSLWATGWRPSVADFGGSVSASCKPQVQLFSPRYL